MTTFAQLSMAEKNRIIIRLELRRSIWIKAKLAQLKAPQSYLLVGDRPGPGAPKDAEYHHTPFYSTRHCSGWLNIALDAESIPEERLVWINSADQYGDPYPIKIVKNLETQTIIALGSNASNWLNTYSIEHIKISHPQFWRRFKSKEPYKLLELLRELRP